MAYIDVGSYVQRDIWVRCIPMSFELWIIERIQRQPSRVVVWYLLVQVVSVLKVSCTFPYKTCLHYHMRVARIKEHVSVCMVVCVYVYVRRVGRIHCHWLRRIVNRINQNIYKRNQNKRKKRNILRAEAAANKRDCQRPYKIPPFHLRLFVHTPTILFFHIFSTVRCSLIKRVLYSVNALLVIKIKIYEFRHNDWRENEGKQSEVIMNSSKIQMNPWYVIWNLNQVRLIGHVSAVLEQHKNGVHRIQYTRHPLPDSCQAELCNSRARRIYYNIHVTYFICHAALLFQCSFMQMCFRDFVFIQNKSQ